MHDILVLCQSADSVVDTLCATESEVVELCRKRYAELMASHGSADAELDCIWGRVHTGE